MTGFKPRFESDDDRIAHGNFAIKLLLYPRTIRTQITTCFKIKRMPNLEMRKLVKDR